MIIDGEKYACEACVRGHRVSNCQHSDRPLQHINKKGRPVSQCQHCRTMRKSRTAHVKCDCGEKTSKCSHLQNAIEGHRETCCCNHGGRCSCSHKRDVPQLDTVPESDSDKESSSVNRPKVGVRRRRANTIHSDGMLSFDEHGNHRPTHKHNRVSQKCGPYQLNRVNSLHSTSSLGNRSVENLAGESRSREPVVSRALSSRQQRRVKSETASPLLSGSSSFQQLNGQLPPLDLSAIEYPSYNLASSTFDLFGSGFSSDHDGPMFSAGLSATSVDWSHYDLDLKGENFAPSSYSQGGAQSFNGLFEYPNGSEHAPTLAGTTSTSGEVSEVEDNFLSGDVDFDGFGTSQNPYMRSSHMLASGRSMDYETYMKNSANKFLPVPASLDDGGPIAGGPFSMVEDDPAFWASGYNDTIPSVAESPEGHQSASFWDGQ